MMVKPIGISFSKGPFSGSIFVLGGVILPSTNSTYSGGGFSGRRIWKWIFYKDDYDESGGLHVGRPQNTESREHNVVAPKYWLVVSTHLKNISQIRNFPQIGVKIKNIWNHHLEVELLVPFLWTTHLFFVGLTKSEKWTVQTFSLKNISLASYVYRLHVKRIHKGWIRSCLWKNSCTSWWVVCPTIYMVWYIPGVARYLPPQL